MIQKRLKTKSAISYFGSDSEVASDLASMLDHCSHVTIPFCGGLSILPHLSARAIVANDLHELAINFYRVMSDKEGRQTLIDRCQATLSHPSEYSSAKEICDTDLNYGNAERAWAFWALCWIGRKGKGGTRNQNGMPSVRRTAVGGTNASRIRSAANGLEEWARQFERCEWESIDFRNLLPKVADNASCGLYCDPPWVGLGDGYQHSFKSQDHIDLAEALHRFEQTTVVVRYGDNNDIRRMYSDWTIVKAESRTQSNSVKGELWTSNQRIVNKGLDK